MTYLTQPPRKVYNVHDMKQWNAPKLFSITDNPTRRGLYFAYGSNLHLSQMLGHRCPNAKPLFKCQLNNWKLVFRGVADIEREKGSSVIGGLFQITPDCEKALDIYEGYPRMYTKATATVKMPDDSVETIMFYVMTNQMYQSAPNESYFNTILKGYADFQMSDQNFRDLEDAADRADQLEMEYRRRNPDMVRGKRGRYVPKAKPFIAARELQKRVVNPYPDEPRSFLDVVNDDPETDLFALMNDTDDIGI
jgi:gamma-glutamylcyclotransferase (GGCT)/AIG2-like uncharacterized protein YtfP